MIRAGKRLLGFGVALVLAGCASAPMHYYTLVAPANDSASGSPFAGTSAPLPFSLLPVSIPAQVDLPQLVVRQGDQQVVLLDGERWAAPLADEVRSALSVDLAHDLGAPDLGDLPSAGKPILQIKLDLRRFDSQPGGYALIDGSWSIRILHGVGHGDSLTCSSRISEPVGSGYQALVQGHQRAIGRLAAQMALAARSLQAGQSSICPAS